MMMMMIVVVVVVVVVIIITINRSCVALLSLDSLRFTPRHNKLDRAVHIINDCKINVKVT